MEFKAAPFSSIKMALLLWNIHDNRFYICIYKIEDPIFKTETSDV